MCIVLDVNVIPLIFSVEAESHDQFKPLLTWITNDVGKIVYGGEKYKQELSKLRKYLKLFSQLKKAGKAIEIDGDQVDQYQEELEEQVSHRDFDDPHLIAIIIVSRCRLIATAEKRAIPFFKDSKFYPSGVKKPKIYTGIRNVGLLTRRNVANICLPISKQLVALVI